MPEIVNVDQAAAWDGPSGDAWVAREELQNEALQPYTDALLTAAAVQRHRSRARRRLRVRGDDAAVRTGRGRRRRGRSRPVGRDARRVGPIARRRGGDHQRRVRAGGCPGARVHAGVVRPGREPLRRDVLRRSRRRVHQPRARRGPGWAVRGDRVADVGAQRLDAVAARRPGARSLAAGPPARCARAVRPRRPRAHARDPGVGGVPRGRAHRGRPALPLRRRCRGGGGDGTRDRNAARGARRTRCRRHAARHRRAPR